MRNPDAAFLEDLMLMTASRIHGIDMDAEKFPGLVDVEQRAERAAKILRDSEEKLEHHRKESSGE